MQHWAQHRDPSFAAGKQALEKISDLAQLQSHHDSLTGGDQAPPPPGHDSLPSPWCPNGALSAAMGGDCLGHGGGGGGGGGEDAAQVGGGSELMGAASWLAGALSGIARLENLLQHSRQHLVPSSLTGAQLFQ